MVVFSFQMQLMFSIFYYKYSTIKYSLKGQVNTYYDEQMTFIGQRSGQALQWRHIEVHNIEDQIPRTASKVGES